MRIVLVQHKPHQQRFYCFYAPYSLAKYMGNSDGMSVKCRTQKGIQPGKIIGGVVSGKLACNVVEERGLMLPLQQIDAVCCNVNVHDIVVPAPYRRTKPNQQKLERRKSEYLNCGQFSNRITISSDGVLIDGYTTYLVAIDLGIVN